jgi:hypothetical protein
VKYYVYISDSKLDMLYSQVPHSVKKKVSTDMKIDFKVFGGSRKSEKETEENRMTKLEAVVRFIEENEDVGTVDSDGRYFADSLEMRWGALKCAIRRSGRGFLLHSSRSGPWRGVRRLGCLARLAI